METIFALATARGKAGVAVIRVSGPAAFEVGRALCGSIPKPGRFALRRIRGSSGAVLDEGLVLAFEAPHSFTAEDIVEFQLHGSIAVVRAVEAAIADTGLARYAEAGEFSRRALMNGALDIAQIEALGDLIEAETERQREQAQRLLDGSLRDLVEFWRGSLLRALALTEAVIDFADEAVPVDTSAEAGKLIGEVLLGLQQEIDGSRVSEQLRSGFEVAILGPPNVGKSTLLNQIAGRDIAITSEIAGTTRDVLEARVDLFGIPVTFLDTAGLREAQDHVERIGIARALARGENADIRLYLVPPDEPLPEQLGRTDDIWVHGKGDTMESENAVSGLTGAGVDRVLGRIQEILEQRLERAGSASHQRHRDAMTRAVSNLDMAQTLLVKGHAAELAAEHMRAALHALDSLIGRVDVEDVLGEIFSRFCIGK